jgi:hypothetical protein
MKTKWTLKIAGFALAFCLILMVADLAFAEIPETITYQGRLRGAQGGLVNDTLSMTFSIYDSHNAPTALWTELHPDVEVTNGEFTVALGSIVSFESAGLEFDTQYFLGIAIESDPEMNPRMPFTSVGYALHALRAQNADHSNQSEHSNQSNHSEKSDHSDKSDEADYATSAGTADSATNAEHAVTADTATDAEHATSAAGLDPDYIAPHAALADYATDAGTAMSAGSATEANYAEQSGQALEAAHAWNADFADYARSPLYKGVAVVAPEFVDGENGPGYYTDPVTALDEINIWCGVPSAENPCLVKIMPGRYYLGSVPAEGQAALNLKPHVSLEGSGPESTIIRSPHPVIYAEGSNDIRLLAIVVTNPYSSFAVRVGGGVVTISDVNLIGPAKGINNLGDLRLTDANIFTGSVGISNKHKIRMHGVYTFGSDYGLLAYGPDTCTEIFDSKIVGEDYSIDREEDSDMKILGSYLVSEHSDVPFNDSFPLPTIPAVCAGSIFEDSHGDVYLLDKDCDVVVP